MAGFRAPGIYPFNRNAFTDDELASSFVTDRPMEASASDTGQPRNASESQVTATLTITPEQIGLFPKPNLESFLALDVLKKQKFSPKLPGSLLLMSQIPHCLQKVKEGNY